MKSSSPPSWPFPRPPTSHLPHDEEEEQEENIVQWCHIKKVGIEEKEDGGASEEEEEGEDVQVDG